MASNKTQRWAILVIMIVTVIGTLGSFAVMILAQQNQTKLASEYQTALDAYNKEGKAYQALLTVQSDELSKKYYNDFKNYSSYVGKYEIASVSAVTTEDLTVGDGEEITGATKFAAYYIGWDANANVFDQSIDKAANKLKNPLPVATGLDNASLIDGWKEGMKGMHVGGVRLISIPSDKAYKEQGQKDQSGNVTIAPNMPLKFVVMAIPMPEEVPQPKSLQKAFEDYSKAAQAYQGQQQ